MFVGRNGEGKTNLVEAVGYLARWAATGSPPTRRWSGTARRRPSSGRRCAATTASCWSRSRSTRAGPTGCGSTARPLPRPRELLGLVRTVLFAPEDLALVRGDPSERRRFLDELLVSRTPRLAGVRTDYDRVLKQRNALLKTAAAAAAPGADAPETLDVWDAHLVELGGPAAGRPAGPGRRPGAAPGRGLRRRGRPAAAAALGYRSTCRWPASGAVQQTVPQLPSERGAARAIAERRGDEVDRGMTLVGPHRDDLVLHLGPAAGPRATPATGSPGRWRSR